AMLVAVSYGVIFLSDRRFRAHGWLTVEALAGAFYPAFVFGVTQIVFGTSDLALSGVAIAVAVSASVYFIHEHYQLGAPHRLWSVGVVLCLLAAVASYGDPFRE